jgi:hypothetical protein
MISPLAFEDNITAVILQLIAVPKARIEKLPFWEFFDSRDRFAHISMGSALIRLKSG